ncbi:hypothetical protein BDV98DRAFT_272772, partial [Pterulicium gracile]
VTPPRGTDGRPPEATSPPTHSGSSQNSTLSDTPRPTGADPAQSEPTTAHSSSLTDDPTSTNTSQPTDSTSPTMTLADSPNGANESDGGGSSNPNTATIVGGVIGGIITLLLLAILIICAFRRKRARRMNRHMAQPTNFRLEIQSTRDLPVHNTESTPTTGEEVLERSASAATTPSVRYGQMKERMELLEDQFLQLQKVSYPPPYVAEGVEGGASDGGEETM